MVGIQGPQAAGNPGWGDPSWTPPPTPPRPGGLAGGEKVMVALASVVAVAALIGGSIFVVGQRGDETADPPDTTDETTETTDETTETTDETTETTDETTTGGLGGPASYDSYSEVSDASGRITVDLPDEWTDVNVDGIFVDQTSDETTPAIQASPDLDAFRETFNESGAELVLYASGILLTDVASFYDESCRTDEGERGTETGGGLEGSYNLFSGCTGPDGEPSDGLIYQGLFDVDSDTVLYVNINMQTDADIEALEEILSTVTAA